MESVDFNRELHARPSIYFAGPALVCHVAYLGRDNEHTHRHEQFIDAGSNVKLALETHAEFHTRTSVLDLADNPADWPDVPEASLSKITSADPAVIRVQILVLSEPEEKTHVDSAFLERFGIRQPAGSVIAGGDATIYSDFRITEGGFGRILLINRGLNDYRLGRMVRRIYEIETYRAMALLGLPLALETGAALPQLDARLIDLSKGTVNSSKTDPRGRLDQLSDLSFELSRAIAKTSHRFGATRAYADIVEDRIRDLRETHVPGLQRYGIFLNRRFGPAIRTCAATERRLDRLAANVAHLVGLLQTKIQVELQEQNVQSLKGMEARTASQVKIQKAVEGLSVIAITYYAASLIKLSLEALEYSHIVQTKSWMLVALPLTLFASASAIFLVRRALKSE